MLPATRSKGLTCLGPCDKDSERSGGKLSRAWVLRDSDPSFMRASAVPARWDPWGSDLRRGCERCAVRGEDTGAWGPPISELRGVRRN